MALLLACNKTPQETPQPGTPEVPEETTNAICIDALLLVETDAVPTITSSGKITVEDEKGKVIDLIDMADLETVTIREDGQMIPKEKIEDTTPYNTFMDILRSGGSERRIVHYTPVRATEKGLEVRLHSYVLDFDKSYTLKVDAGVIEGGDAITMEFKTKPKPSDVTKLSVRPDGKGDFCTIQGAVTYAGTASSSTATTISIAAGTYPEMLYIRNRANLTLKGTGKRDQCVITYANCEKYEGGSGGNTSKPSVGSSIGKSGGRCLILVENCDNLRLENLTVRNTFDNRNGQAETIYFNSGSNAHKLTIENCELWSWQDTFLTKGLVWVHNSLIAGHCDYIWGYPQACLFEDCEIRSLADGYIVQARVQKASDKGFVFLNCRLTAADGVANGKMTLARSGGDATKFDNVTYINCKMGPVIAATGWYANPKPNPATPTAVSGWKEYGTTDLSGNPLTGHSALGKYLTEAEAAAFSSKEAVLGDF